MAAAAICEKVWAELRRLRELPALQNDHDSYSDYASFMGCNEVRSTLGPCAELPRDQFLSVFKYLVAGPRLQELVLLFMGSRHHPALQYACLIALHGVAELSDRRQDMLTNPELTCELLVVMASPRQRAITPPSDDPSLAEEVNGAAGALTTIAGLFSSNCTLEPEYAKLWIQQGAIGALCSCLESHASFDFSSPVTADIPWCLFVVSTSLLAGAAAEVPEHDKLRLGKAWLQVFVEARLWIAHEAAEVLADFYTRPNWLKIIVPRIPETLRVQAVRAARTCEAQGGSWSSGRTDHLATALRCVNEDSKGSSAKRCAGPGCVRVQSDGQAVHDIVTERFKRCSQCRSVVYCSRDCQAAHWKAGHRKACGAARGYGF